MYDLRSNVYSRKTIFITREHGKPIHIYNNINHRNIELLQLMFQLTYHIIKQQERGVTENSLHGAITVRKQDDTR